MPPVKSAAIKKSTASSNAENSVCKTMTRSSKLSIPTLKKENSKESFPKRKAVSPIKGNTLKRSALGNITNAIETQCVITIGKKSSKKPESTVTKPTLSTAAKTTQPLPSVKKSISTNVSKPSRKPLVAQADQSQAMPPPLPKSRLTLPAKAVASVVNLPKSSLGRPSLRAVSATVVNKPSTTVEKADNCNKHVNKQSLEANQTAPAVAAIPASKCKITVKPKHMVSTVPNTRRSSGRRSTLDSTDSSLYVSALSEISDGDIVCPAIEHPLPEPEINIDAEYVNDPFQCATYAYEIFEYLKSREDHFKIEDYMEMQGSLSNGARAILVDWMVEIQENFELNHETLYLGVKLMDTYLSKVKVSKQCLQLVGATAMLIAAKYDERIPPSIDDFLYICDGAYKRKDIGKMEVLMLKVINFELGFPLSYRFLRRYARCAKAPMPLLTLARYILEYTLMDYSTIALSDSKMAAAALYLAFKMKKELQWNNTLIHFSGYRVNDFISIAHTLNNSLHQKPKQALATVRNKYSHKIFYEVAKVPLISNEDL